MLIQNIAVKNQIKKHIYFFSVKKTIFLHSLIVIN